MELTDLYLVGCNLKHKPTFNGFGSLTSLCVQEAGITKKLLLHLLSNSPLLKSVDITNSLIHSDPDSDLDRDDSTIINLFECFPVIVIEKLSICFLLIECFAEKGLPEELPATLVHVKYLFIDDTNFMHIYGLPSIALLIRSSPNLEKLMIKILGDSWFDIDEINETVNLEDYSDIYLEHLNELEIINMIYKKPELDFVKLILAKSPVLKKVTIFLNNKVAKDEEFEISIILLSCQRASPSVKVIIEFVEGS